MAEDLIRTKKLHEAESGMVEARKKQHEGDVGGTEKGRPKTDASDEPPRGKSEG